MGYSELLLWKEKIKEYCFCRKECIILRINGISMKKLSGLIVLLLMLLPIANAQTRSWVKSRLSVDSTMVYDYHYTNQDCNDPSFVLVSRVGAPTVSLEQTVEKPYWFLIDPNVVKRHWNTYGKEVDAILDNLKVEKRTLRVRLVYSLRTGELMTMRIFADETVAFLLNLLPLERIFSIYESIDTSQFITICDHKPCDEDNKFTIIDAVCR